MAMEMPIIIDCDVSECAYNSENICHAMAITVGDSAPLCDTFLRKDQKGGAMDVIGGVGACKVDSCKFNQSLECSADGIHVGRHADQARCDTFSPR
jgi:hypothetical protein